MKIRNHGLDTLRALAIVLVVLHHYVIFVSLESTFGWVGDVGWVGVDLFFGLSGYLIGHQILSAGPALSLPRFYARRLLRTLPAFYAVLALYWLWPWFGAGMDMPPLWRFLTFTQNIGLEPGTAFSHAWSLCIEEQFYLLLPAVVLAAAGRRLWAVLALGVGAGMLLRAGLWSPNQHDYFQDVYYASWCRFDELLAGVALALLRNRHPALWERMTRHGNRTLAAGVAVSGVALALFAQARFNLLVTVFGFPLLALGCGLLILAALSERSLLRTLRVPGAGALAAWSYSTYLIHKQVCILAEPYLAQAGFKAEHPVAIGAMLAASVLAGWLIYRCVERPFMALRDRLVPDNLDPNSPR